MASKKKRTVSDLTAAPYNPRRITPEKLAMLADSMATFGDLSGIIYNRRTGFLIGGHQRVKNITSSATVDIENTYDPPTQTGTVLEGSIEVAGERWQYREVDVDEDLEKMMNVSANYQRASFDYSGLAEIATDLDARGFEVGLLGMTEDDLAAIVNFDGSDKDEEKEEGEGGPVVCPHCGLEI